MSTSHDKNGVALIERYNANERSNHWVTAILFVLLALSGLAMFHPATAWMALLFGGGQWTRILHPFFGVLMALSFAGLVVRFWRHNLFDKGDREWLARPNAVLHGHEESLPKVGRYNGGQKVLFFVLVACMAFLLVTGIVMWRAYFSALFPVELIRLSSLLHALFAFVIILGIIVHVYAGLWVKGTMGAMTRGTVTFGWAHKHHPRWFEEEMRKGRR